MGRRRLDEISGTSEVSDSAIRAPKKNLFLRGVDSPNHEGWIPRRKNEHCVFRDLYCRSR